MPKRVEREIGLTTRQAKAYASLEDFLGVVVDVVRIRRSGSFEPDRRGSVPSTRLSCNSARLPDTHHRS
jgi:hypothetical protein